MNANELSPERSEHQALRRRFRARLRFFRHVAEFVVLGGLFFLVDWATGGEGSGINWAQWVAGIWAACLAWEFSEIYVAPPLRRWERATAEGMARREVRRPPEV